jgi:protein-L-isoaspartate O-methyltransferase
MIAGRFSGLARLARVEGEWMTSQFYPLGGTQNERDRLLRQAKAYEPQANWLLDQIGVQRGWRAIDIGCGPIGILNLLSERVGPEGRVVGLEREGRFVEMGKAEIAKRGLHNVEMDPSRRARYGG